MAAKIGNEPSMGVRQVFVFFPTEGATSVSGLDANGANLSYEPFSPPNVYLNGVKLVSGHDYVATTGSSITGIAPMHAGDVVVVEVFGTWSPADAYTKAEANAQFLQKTGGSLTGSLLAINALIAQATANSNAHVWLRNADGKNRGLVYWDRNNGVVVLRVYADDGNGNDIAAGSLVLYPNGTMTFNGYTVWHSGNLDPWASIPLRVPIPVFDHLGGGAPPTDKWYRYVKLTAGETGAGQYNQGVLTSESVSGSAPLVNATAVINLPSSPIHGQTVRLINTERRFIRAGSSGVLQDDAMQTHSHPYTVPFGMGGATGGATQFYWSVTTSNTANNNGRTDSETRPRNIGATYYMRIL